jgi:lincosamide nucleotidyltransferase B/F
VDPKAYRAFTARLTASLADRDDVLGLVAAGSMAEIDYMPDRWSDHDFWVIVRVGAQARYRAHHDWLPDDAAIAWAFRETEHGVKALYRDGYLLEYAVFDRDELHLARLNRYRVLLDRADVAARIEQVEAATLHGAAEAGDAFYAGQFLTNLLVGMGRYRRGEALSAHRFIKVGRCRTC